jgi:hypothetical protein
VSGRNQQARRSVERRDRHHWRQRRYRAVPALRCRPAEE